MSLDVADPIQTHPIAGIGPYGTDWPYFSGCVVAEILRPDGVRQTLTSLQFGMTPDDASVSGDAYLQPDVAAIGGTLILTRVTPDEQGWIGLTSAKERGLEGQLDQTMMAVQELRSLARRSLRTDQPIAPFQPEEGRLLIGGANGSVRGDGPNAQDIAAAQSNAVIARDERITAQLAAAQAKLYDGPWLDDVAALLADTVLTYAPGQPSTVLPGGIVRTRAEGFSYLVVPAVSELAPDGYHIATASGVKLAVIANASATSVEAFGVPIGPVGGLYSDSTAAIQRAWDWSGLSSDRGRAIIMCGDYAISGTLTKPALAQIFSDRRAVFRKLPGAPILTGPAVLIGNGNHLGRTDMPSFAQFAGVVVEIQGDIGHIYVPQFNTCGTAWKVSAGVTDQTILDCVLEFDAISNCDVAAECFAANATAVIQGLQIKGNFITNTTDGLIMTGFGAYDDGIVFDVLAVDFTPNKPGGALFDNRVAGHGVPRLNAYVRSWLGGAGFLDPVNPTQLFKGRWDNISADFVNAADFTDLNQVPNLVRGSSIKLRRDTAVAAALELGTIGGGQASFNGGRMLSRDTFLAKVTLTADVGAGQTTSRVFFHAFGDANFHRFAAQKQQGASGMIVDFVHDQTGTVPGRVAIAFRNVGTTTIASGTVFYVAVQRY